MMSPGNAGVPDRLVVLPGGGRIGFVGLKANGNKPTRLQERQMDRIRGLGCFVCVLDAVENIQDVISGIRLCRSSRDTESVMAVSGKYGI